jgi:hypothetical protein
MKSFFMLKNRGGRYDAEKKISHAFVSLGTLEGDIPKETNT